MHVDGNELPQAFDAAKDNLRLKKTARFMILSRQCLKPTSRNSPRIGVWGGGGGVVESENANGTVEGFGAVWRSGHRSRQAPRPRPLGVAFDAARLSLGKADFQQCGRREHGIGWQTRPSVSALESSSKGVVRSAGSTTGLLLC